MLGVRLFAFFAAWWLWWWWCFVGGVVGQVSEGPVTLTTPSGRLRGERYILHDGSRGVRFLGIPYAKPPLGPLRFAVSHTSFFYCCAPREGILNVIRVVPQCLLSCIAIAFLYPEIAHRHDHNVTYLPLLSC